MLLSIIVAASTNNVIGKGNNLPWHLPNDMKFFKNTTWSMPVIMGRRTYESLAVGELPGRINIVVSRQGTINKSSPSVLIATSLDQAIKLAEETDCKEAFIIGGAQIYAASIPVADKIFLTRVHTVLDGDAFFPALDPNQWKLAGSMDFPADQTHAYPFSFQEWIRTSR
jgi:dihydrofolate reductase